MLIIWRWGLIIARNSRRKPFGGRVGKDLAEKIEKFLQLKIERNYCDEEQEKLIKNGFGVGVFGWKFGWNLTLEGVLRHTSRLE